jgi:hypothetical protein
MAHKTKFQNDFEKCCSNNCWDRSERDLEGWKKGKTQIWALFEGCPFKKWLLEPGRSLLMTTG